MNKFNKVVLAVVVVGNLVVGTAQAAQDPVAMEMGWDQTAGDQYREYLEQVNFELELQGLTFDQYKELRFNRLVETLKTVDDWDQFIRDYSKYEDDIKRARVYYFG